MKFQVGDLIVHKAFLPENLYAAHPEQIDYYHWKYSYEIVSIDDVLRRYDLKSLSSSALFTDCDCDLIDSEYFTLSNAPQDKPLSEDLTRHEVQNR